MKLRVACAQFNATEDVARNTARSIAYIKRAARRKVKFLLFPEAFHFRGSSALYKLVAEPIPSAKVKVYQNLARQYHMAILLGGLTERCAGQRKYYSTALLISEKGRIVVRYRKRHLFQAHLRNRVIRESNYFKPGRQYSYGKIFGVPVGISICFDLRYPALFEYLRVKGVRIVCVPSNFTKETGRAHWEVLVRARAIENQFFMVAPAQCGYDVLMGQPTFGTSLIVDPWGKVVARGSARGEGLICADIDLSAVDRVRKKIVMT